jgi:hypothetical protein
MRLNYKKEFLNAREVLVRIENMHLGGYVRSTSNGETIVPLYCNCDTCSEVRKILKRTDCS